MLDQLFQQSLTLLEMVEKGGERTLSLSRAWQGSSPWKRLTATIPRAHRVFIQQQVEKCFTERLQQHMLT